MDSKSIIISNEEEELTTNELIIIDFILCPPSLFLRNKVEASPAARDQRGSLPWLTDSN